MRASTGMFGLALAAVLSWALFRGTDWIALREVIFEIDLAWILLAQVLALSSHLFRVRRWKATVGFSDDVSFRHLLSATQIGMLVNILLPARAGDVVRAYLLSTLANIGLARAMALAALDRVNDIVSLLATMMICIFVFDWTADVLIPRGTVGNPEAVVVSGEIVHSATLWVGAFLVVAVGMLSILYWRHASLSRFSRVILGRISPEFARRISEGISGFGAGLSVLGSGRSVASSIGWSFAAWSASAGSLAAIVFAFGLDMPPSTPWVMLVLIAVSVSVPVSPGLVGQYHVAVVAALLVTIPLIDATEAKAVALVSHISALIPITVLGMVCLHLEGRGVLEVVRSSEASQRAALEEARPGAEVPSELGER